MKTFRIFLGLLLWLGVAPAQQYSISTIAGGVPPQTPVEAVKASIGAPSAVVTDNTGNVYFTSASRHCVFRLDPAGILTRVAGNTKPGYSGDGGLATNARLNNPLGLAIDKAGNLFFADSLNHRIRKVSPDGIITTVAGGGSSDLRGGGPATSVALDADYYSTDQYIPRNVAVDGAGNLFILHGYVVFKVSPNGIIARVAGFDHLLPSLEPLGGLAVDSAGNLLISARGYGVYLGMGIIVKVSPDGIMSTFAHGNFGPFAVDSVGNIFTVGGTVVIKVSPGGTVTTVAGSSSLNAGGFSGDGGPATSALLGYNLSGVAVDKAGNLFIADPFNLRVRRISPGGIITTVAGNGFNSFSGDGGPANLAQLDGPGTIIVDRKGSLFIADTGNYRVRKITPDGMIATVAGNGMKGFSGDGGPATNAQLDTLGGIAIDSTGNLFIADSGNYRLRMVTQAGIITTVAGDGLSGSATSGDGGPPTAAQLYYPRDVAIDSAGNLFIATDYRLRKISGVPGNRVISTIPTVEFGTPYSLAFDTGDNLFILAWSRNHPIHSELWKLSPDGLITNVIPNALAGAIAHDGAGNLFISGRIRRISSNGAITSVDAVFTELADSGNNTYSAGGIAADGTGNLYTSDYGAIRLLRPVKPVLIGSVLDGASERANQIAPGKIVVIYGGGLGPPQLTQFSAVNGVIGTQLEGTSVSFNGVAAPILYTSATQVAAIVPYSISGNTVQVRVGWQGQLSDAYSVPLAASAPSLFTANGTGAGQAVAINAAGGALNNAANPVKIGGYISIFATGEGLTSPAGVDGKLPAMPIPRPTLPVTATVGGIPGIVQYAGGASGYIPGVMMVNVQIPGGVRPGGYVPVVIQVGDAASGPGVWIAVSN